MRVLAISGSLRRDSHNTRLLRVAAELVPPSVELELFDAGRTLTNNLAVDDVRAIKTVVRTDAPVIVTASVLNAGPFAAKAEKSTRGMSVISGAMARASSIFHSTTCLLGSIATRRLTSQAAGFSRLKNLKGGILGWISEVDPSLPTY